MVFLNMYPLNRPVVMVPFAEGKFDGSGRLVDEPTRKRVRELLEALASKGGPG
jgi:chromate reductase